MKKLRLITLTGFLLLGITGLRAQNYLSQYNISQYWQNYFLVNPAYAGKDSAKAANVWSRYSYSQLTQFDLLGAGVAYHAPIPSLNSGYGFSLVYESTGYNSETYTLNAAYSYKIETGDESDLQFGSGIQGLYRSDSIQYNPQVAGTIETYSFALSFGLLYRTNGFTFGVSGLNLNQPPIRNQIQGTGTLRIPRVIYGVGRYEHEVSPDVWFIPGVMIRAIDSRSTIALELRTDFDFAHTFEAGLAYRISQLGNRPYEISGYRFNQTINFLIPRLGLRFSDGAYFHVSYDIPVVKNNNQAFYSFFNYLEASLKFNW